PISVPEGIVRFSLKSSAATSVAAASDRGVLVLAGVLGGPALVTFLKVAGSAARLNLGFVSSAAAQLYPRIAAAAVARDLAGIRRDALRTTALLAVLGVGTVIVMVPLAGPALTILYGSGYRWLADVTTIFLLASCIRGTGIWAKVLPLALGRPGVLLAVMTSDGLLTLSALLLSSRSAGTPEHTVLVFAWADVLLAVLRTATWLVLLRAFTRPADRPAPGGPGVLEVRS
ncbi:MAG: hypothetical protein ACRDOO_04545, partial [Actinomadura sp.]